MVGHVRQRSMREQRVGGDRATWPARIGAQVRALRNRLGLSQTELAQAIGSTAQSVARLEAGRGARGPTVARLDQIARALGTELVITFARPARSPRR